MADIKLLSQQISDKITARLAMWNKKGGNHKIEGTPFAGMTIEGEITLLLEEFLKFRVQIDRMEQDANRYHAIRRALCNGDGSFIQRVNEILPDGTTPTSGEVDKAFDYAITTAGCNGASKVHTV